MKYLGFERVGFLHRGRRIRQPRFDERSELPVSAACLAANGIRETLAGLLSVPLQTRVLEPAIPKATAWDDLLHDAHVFIVRGSLGDAAVVLRPADARALVAAAFGEPGGGERVLSRIERSVLSRLVAAIVPTLAAVCGVNVAMVGEATKSKCAYTTYFEVLIEGGLRARVGIALACDPRVETCGGLQLGVLNQVPLGLRVSLGNASVTAAQLLDLKCGATLPIINMLAARGTLMLGGRALARGECGVRGGRYVLRVGSLAPEGVR
jgi:flagellar motor switch/type III secretory pathway protein FliN